MLARPLSFRVSGSPVGASLFHYFLAGVRGGKEIGIEAFFDRFFVLPSKLCVAGVGS